MPHAGSQVEPRRVYDKDDFRAVEVLPKTDVHSHGGRFSNKSDLWSSSFDERSRLTELPLATFDPLTLTTIKHEEINVEMLMKRVKDLELENTQLRNNLLEQAAPSAEPPLSNKPICKVIYRLDRSSVYLGEPQWAWENKGTPWLKADMPLKDLDLYLERNPNIAFIVYKDYFRSAQTEAYELLDRSEDVLPVPKPDAEALWFTSGAMVDAVAQLTSLVPDFSMLFPDFDPNLELPAPYLFMFYTLQFWDKCVSKLSHLQTDLLSLLKTCVEDSHGREYAEAEQSLANGFVSGRFMKYLIRPGDVVVGNRESPIVSFIASSWLVERIGEPTNVQKRAGKRDYRHNTKGRVGNIDIDSSRSRSPHITLTPTRSEEADLLWECSVWSWEFDGVFAKKNTAVVIGFDDMERDKLVRIQELDFYPLRFASDVVKAKLVERGRTFWKCRMKRFVSYEVQDDQGLNTLSERYMIDIKTYRKLHPDPIKKLLQDDMGHEVMAREEPPGSGQEVIFPPYIIGYNLRLKKWVDLEVDKILDVKWNTEAFESLVVHDEVKELMQALITKQLTAEKSTDLISGKGNGLVILLHGGPGTGKTFTAESVAEIAEKPLYRVTCGDIGTKPEDVEKYLEPTRNALVSVFLRVLEYYDGILILTSNRVGTFDAAFKSRIQLALHYENLSTPSRRKIWRNFMARLKSLEETDIDYEDIADHINDLANEEMNGRQIRNAITTARQLAQYKGQKFSYGHLKHVIGVAAKFENYLRKVQEGMSDDEIARSDRIR